MRHKSLGLAALLLTTAVVISTLGGPRPALAAQGAELEILSVKANVALKEGNWDKALELADKALAQDPDFPAALAVKGRAQMEKGQVDEALATFAQLESLAGDDDSWRVGYGIVLLKAGKNEGALAQLQRAAAAGPTSGPAQYYLGYAQYVVGQYRDAIVSLGRAIDLGYELHRAHYYRGRSHYLLADGAAARADMQGALEADAQGPLASKAREALALLGEIETAPTAGAEEPNLHLRGRLGFSYDSNVTITPDEASSDAVGGDQKDGRIEVELSGRYRTHTSRSTQYGASYRFLGFFQLGLGNATTDFTIFNHTASLFAAHSYNSKDSVSLSGDYVLTTLGRLSEFPGTASFSHGVFSHQAIATLSYFRKLSPSYTLGGFARYAREFYPDDRTLPVAGVAPLDNSFRDANILEAGTRSIGDLQELVGREGTLLGTLSFYWRLNESDASSVGGSAGSASTDARYLGPRLRLDLEMPIPEASDALTLKAQIFYAFEYHYDDGALNQKDNRFYGVLALLYQLNQKVGVEAAYRGEFLRSSVGGASDPSYGRHVGSLSLVFEE